MTSSSLRKQLDHPDGPSTRRGPLALSAAHPQYRRNMQTLEEVGCGIASARCPQCTSGYHPQSKLQPPVRQLRQLRRGLTPRWLRVHTRESGILWTLATTGASEALLPLRQRDRGKYRGGVLVLHQTPSPHAHSAHPRLLSTEGTVALLMTRMRSAASMPRMAPQRRLLHRSLVACAQTIAEPRRQLTTTLCAKHIAQTAEACDCAAQARNCRTSHCQRNWRRHWALKTWTHSICGATRMPATVVTHRRTSASVVPVMASGAAMGLFSGDPTQAL